MKLLQERLMEIIDEVQPLLAEHYDEIAHFKDIPLKPDFHRYQILENGGNLKIYTARDDAKKLIGYAIYIVNKNLHYSDSLQAVQDILFIRKGNRGTGGRLIKFADAELRKIGVQPIYQHVKLKQNFGKLLERMGYEAVEIIYVKRLDKGET